MQNSLFFAHFPGARQIVIEQVFKIIAVDIVLFEKYRGVAVEFSEVHVAHDYIEIGVLCVVQIVKFADLDYRKLRFIVVFVVVVDFFFEICDVSGFGIHDFAIRVHAFEQRCHGFRTLPGFDKLAVDEIA